MYTLLQYFKKLIIKKNIMEKLTLKADKRFAIDLARDLRLNRKIPAVVYGKKQENISIVFDYSDFLRIFRKSGESQIIELDLEGEKIEVLVHEVQKEPISGDFTHIDFYAITRWEKLTTHIHLNFVGKSEAGKLWAVIEELTKELEIKCLPKDLVANFEVDLSLLKEFEDSIKVSDLTIDTEKFEILTSKDTVVALAAKPKVEVISDEAPESDLPEEEGKEVEEEKTEEK